jgi:prepilin peptidase CpaA
MAYKIGAAVLDASIIAPSLILLAGVVDDIRSRRVHNSLVLALIAIAGAAQFLLFGWPGLQQGLIGAGAALLLMAPLVLSRVLGAGDMKLMVAFGFSTNASIVLTVILASLVWGALLGVLRAALGGQLKALMNSTVQVALRRKPAEITLHKIPYTVALAFGWLSYLTIAQARGSLI